MKNATEGKVGTKMITRRKRTRLAKRFIMLDYDMAVTQLFKPLPKKLGSIFNKNKRNKLSIHQEIKYNTVIDKEKYVVCGTVDITAAEELDMNDFRVFISILKIIWEKRDKLISKFVKMAVPEYPETKRGKVKYIEIHLSEIAKNMGLILRRHTYDMILNSLFRFNGVNYIVQVKYVSKDNPDMFLAEAIPYQLLNLVYASSSKDIVEININPRIFDVLMGKEGHRFAGLDWHEVGALMNYKPKNSEEKRGVSQTTWSLYVHICAWIWPRKSNRYEIDKKGWKTKPISIEKLIKWLFDVNLGDLSRSQRKDRKKHLRVCIVELGTALAPFNSIKFEKHNDRTKENIVYISRRVFNVEN